MARRVKLHIDKLVHINDVQFEVYRSTEPGVDENDEHIMTVDDALAIKQTYTEHAEILQRDPYTPYAFIAKRHFETVPYPTVTVGSTEVEPVNVEVFPDEKMIEVHTGEIGLWDGRTVYLDYEYKAIPLFDDYRTESGKTYMGTPATGLRTPLEFHAEQDFVNNKIHILFEANENPVNYFYRIFARDTDGNISPWSDELYMALTPSEVFFRIERSKDQTEWEDVSYSNMMEWYDDMVTADNPANVQNLHIQPYASKETKIMFDNPWYYWNTYERKSYTYRVRAEDTDGEHTNWIYFGPFNLFIEPQELLIRRKLNNGAPSTKTGIDAFDFLRLRKEDIDITAKTIELIDDQLSDATVYSYTFFLTDALNKEAAPVFEISDHTPWANVMLFKNTTMSDSIRSHDFITTFEVADRQIEIADGEV